MINLVMDLDGVIADTHVILKYYFLGQYKYQIPNNMYQIEIPGIRRTQIEADIIHCINSRWCMIKSYKDAEEYLYKFYELNNKNPLKIMTSRDKFLKFSTERWFEYYFPDIKFELYFTPGKEKGKIIKELNCKYLIEDNVENANNAIEYLNKVYLINRTWNEGKDIKDGVIRVNGWKEIYDDFTKE